MRFLRWVWLPVVDAIRTLVPHETVSATDSPAVRRGLIFLGPQRHP